MNIRSVHMKIFTPGNKGYIWRHFKVGSVLGRKRFLTDAGVDHCLELAAAIVERLYPQHEYSVVQAGPNQFNFVWQREKLPVQTPAQGAAA